MSFVENLNWANGYAFIGVISSISLFMIFLLRSAMSRNFVSHKDHEMLGARLAGVERQIRDTATKADFQHLEARLKPVEVGVAVLTERTQGIIEGVHRTERMVAILLEHHLGKPVA